MNDPPAREPDDLYRLYRPEWIVVHTIVADPDNPTPLDDQLREYFDTHYLGRVRPADVNFLNDATGINEVAQLVLRLPNLKGEFKHAALAQRHADEQGFTDHTIVVRNSDADHALRGYSVKKLASP